MRIRCIKPEFFNHTGIFDAERESKFPLRVAYAGLWCAADREGRFKWEPRRLGICILPYDEIDFSHVLDALLSRGFIVKYRVKDEYFGCIPTFKKHQIVNNKERASCIMDVSQSEEVIVLPSRDGRVDDAIPKEGKGREGKEIARAPFFLLPEKFHTNEKLVKAWNEFQSRYKKKTRLPMSESTMQKHVARLEEWGEPKFLQALNKSIDRGWQDIFLQESEELPIQNGNGHAPETWKDNAWKIIKHVINYGPDDLSKFSEELKKIDEQVKNGDFAAYAKRSMDEKQFKSFEEALYENTSNRQE